MFATDFSKVSGKILRCIPDLGVKKVVLVHVVNLMSVIWIRRGFNIDEWLCFEVKDCCRKLSSMAEYLEGMGIKARYVYSIGDPASEIVNVAKREGVSAIIVGSRGRSVNKDVMLGSVAEGVLRNSAVPVIIVKNGLKIRRAVSLAENLKLDDVEIIPVREDNPKRVMEILRNTKADALIVKGLNVCNDAVIRYSDVTVIYFPNSSLIPGSI